MLQEGYHKRGEAMLASYPSKRAMVVCCGSAMEIARHKLKIPKKDNLCCSKGEEEDCGCRGGRGCDNAGACL